MKSCFTFSRELSEKKIQTSTLNIFSTIAKRLQIGFKKEKIQSEAKKKAS